jgi:hypothetical protein
MPDDANDPTAVFSPSTDPNGVSTPCNQCTITSETLATQPPNRGRTKVGVGEEVLLTISPGPATWSASGGGSISPTSGTSVTYVAGERAGSVTVTAQGSGCSCSITLTVVEPSGMKMVRESNVRHEQGAPDCGFLARPYLPPDDVSFTSVEVREKNSKATASGYYAPFNGITHQPAAQTESAWFTVGDPVGGLGSKVNCQDQIYSGHTGQAVQVGQMTFPITWEFRVNGGAAKALPGFEQRHVVTAAGDCTSSKAGTRETTHLNDATQGY